MMKTSTLYKIVNKRERERLVDLIEENKPKHDSNLKLAERVMKEQNVDVLKYIIMTERECTSSGNREWITTELYSVIENPHGKQFNYRAFLGSVKTNIILAHDWCEKAPMLHSSKITELLKNNNVLEYDVRGVLSEKSTTEIIVKNPLTKYSRGNLQ